MIDNELYYENAEGIVRWDIVCGERKLVFGFVENGIQDYYKKQLRFLYKGIIIKHNKNRANLHENVAVSL